ncbi:UNVERIFIED_CONTAM: hypothetical protein K2H54_045561, partial [Gekko kuhli]
IDKLLDNLTDFLLHQNSLPHSATGKSPTGLLMGRQLATHLSCIHPDLAPDTSRDPIASGSRNEK